MPHLACDDILAVEKEIQALCISDEGRELCSAESVAVMARYKPDLFEGVDKKFLSGEIESSKWRDECIADVRRVGKMILAARTDQMLAKILRGAK